jgi:uncharacterized protein
MSAVSLKATLSLLSERLLEELQEVASPFHRVVVAFSGGVDSTLVLFLAREALGRHRVLACTVDWGPYLPKKARENVLFLVNHLGVEHVFLPGQSLIEAVARGGPSCNLCTKKAKLGSIREHFGDATLILGGANKSDSWGQRGVKLLRNTFSPLFDLSKEEVFALASFLGVPLRRIGEHAVREGCFLKHLLKPLAVPSFHGRAVVESNEILLRLLDEAHCERSIANVTVIGPLRENIALINVRPLPEEPLRSAIEKALSSLPTLQRVVWVDAPLRLVVRANPGQYNNEPSLIALERGRIQPDFAFPVRCVFMPSTNRRLRTFHVVDFAKER